MPDYVQKNVITRSLGPNPKVQVDLEGPHPVVTGDTFDVQRRPFRPGTR